MVRATTTTNEKRNGEFKSNIKESNSPAFSDISDDGAPTLEKEEANYSLFLLINLGF